MKVTAFAPFLAATLSASIAAEDRTEHKMFAQRLPHPSRDWIIEIDGVTYTSLDDLKKAIERLPAGSRLVWYAGCFLFVDVPLGPEPRMKIADFEKFCSEHGIVFTTNHEGSC